MFRPVPTALLAAPLLALLTLVLAARDGGAQIQPAAAAVYTVPGIAVEATAETTDLARDSAFADGQRQAAAALFQRLGVGPTQVDPATLSDADLAGLVQGFQIDNERTSPGRYVAELTFRFRPEAVRAMLNSRGVAFNEATPAAVQPVVLLPVYRDGEGARLWGGANAWHAAWLENSSAAEAVSVIVPFGDLRDVGAINAEQAVAGDPQALQAINELYQADEAVVVVAEPHSWTLSVTLSRYGADMLPRTTVFSVPGDPSDPTVLRQAIEQTVARLLQDRGAASPAVASAAPPVPGGAMPPGVSGSSTLTLRVPLASRDDWFRTQQSLSRVTLVSGVRLLSLSVREVLVEVDYAGSQDQLRSALAGQGLVLEQGASGPELRPGF